MTIFPNSSVQTMFQVFYIFTATGNVCDFYSLSHKNVIFFPHFPSLIDIQHDTSLTYVGKEIQLWHV